MRICGNEQFVEAKCAQYSDKQKECTYLNDKPPKKAACYYWEHNRCRDGKLIFEWIDYLIFGYKWESAKFDEEET